MDLFGNRVVIFLNAIHTLKEEQKIRTFARVSQVSD